MNVRSNLPYGFRIIYIPNHPLKDEMICPKKTPYIIFELPKTDENIDYFDRLDEINFSILGFEKKKSGNYFLIITGHNKVIKAIELFLTLKEYQNKENESLFSQLNEYKKQCIKAQNEKVKNPVPFKSKLIDRFTIANKIENQNPINYINLIKQNYTSKEFIYKTNFHNRKITEIEAFNGFCYRMLLGKQHPKVRGLHDTAGHRAGIIVEKIPGFQNIREYITLNKIYTFPKEKIISSELLKVWAAAYTEEETDLHYDNYGFDKNGLCVKIDDDRSTWPLTAKYAKVNPETGDMNYEPPISSWPITSNDISNFPAITDAKPYHWMDRLANSQIFNKKMIENIKANNECQKQKYHIFLKRILIPDSVYEGIGLATIASKKTRTLFVNHKIERTNKLKNVLMDELGFQDYIINNFDAIKKIMNEFDEYNKDYSKSTDNYLKINLVAVKNAFLEIKQEIYNKRNLILPDNEIESTHSLINLFLSSSNKGKKIDEINNIDDIVSFLKLNMDFFAAYYSKTTEFVEFREEHTAKINFLNALDQTIDEKDFVRALFGNKNGDSECLKAGNEKEIKWLLKHNQKLVDLLSAELENNTISKWSEFKFNQEINELAERFEKVSFSSSNDQKTLSGL